MWGARSCDFNMTQTRHPASNGSLWLGSADGAVRILTCLPDHVFPVLLHVQQVLASVLCFPGGCAPQASTCFVHVDVLSLFFHLPMVVQSLVADAVGCSVVRIVDLLVQALSVF
jgi:hypothetical protein